MIEYANPWFQVIRDGRFHWIEEAGAAAGAAVLPIVGDRILLLERRRPAQKKATTYEIPRGYAEPGETAAACARRELAEETGFYVGENALRPLGKVRPNTAILASRISLFSVSLSAKATRHAKDDEAEAICWLPKASIAQWLGEGRLEDGFTLAALAFFLANESKAI